MPSVCEACGLALYRPDLADEHRATCPAFAGMLAVVESWEHPARVPQLATGPYRPADGLRWLTADELDRLIAPEVRGAR